jgi:hypothetical protein
MNDREELRGELLTGVAAYIRSLVEDAWRALARGHEPPSVSSEAAPQAASQSFQAFFEKYETLGHYCESGARIRGHPALLCSLCMGRGAIQIVRERLDGVSVVSPAPTDGLRVRALLEQAACDDGSEGFDHMLTLRYVREALAVLEGSSDAPPQREREGG